MPVKRVVFSSATCRQSGIVLLRTSERIYSFYYRECEASLC